MSDKSTIDRLFRNYANELYRYLRSFRLSQADTHDLVQAAFVKLIEADLHTVRQPRAWLYAVGRNLAIDFGRKHGRMTSDQNITLPSDDRPDALTSLLEDEDNKMLWKGFSRLAESDREILRLHLDHKMDVEQMAVVLEKTPGATKVAVHRAKKRLFEQVHEILNSFEKQTESIELSEVAHDART